MPRDDFRVPDISCQGCANTIKRTLGDVPGIESVEVDVPTKTVVVEHADAVTRSQIESSLDEVGYPAA